MGRHKKPKSERKDADLRIPVTTGQKETVLQAAKLAGVDMATWARPILLQAAQAALAALEPSRSQ
jgi:hypothetical protein